MSNFPSSKGGIFNINNDNWKGTPPHAIGKAFVTILKAFNIYEVWLRSEIVLTRH